MSGHWTPASSSCIKVGIQYPYLAECTNRFPSLWAAITSNTPLLESTELALVAEYTTVITIDTEKGREGAHSEKVKIYNNTFAHRSIDIFDSDPLDQT